MGEAGRDETAVADAATVEMAAAARYATTSPVRGRMGRPTAAEAVAVAMVEEVAALVAKGVPGGIPTCR